MISRNFDDRSILSTLCGRRRLARNRGRRWRGRPNVRFIAVDDLRSEATASGSGLWMDSLASIVEKMPGLADRNKCLAVCANVPFSKLREISKTQDSLTQRARP